MKKTFKSLILAMFVFFAVAITSTTFAQDPPPPPEGGHGGGGNQVPGGGAPIGEGLLILTALGAAYGSKKWYNNHKKTIAE
jgi:hypothetical protein